MADQNSQTAAAQTSDDSASGAAETLPSADLLDAALDVAVEQMGMGNDDETDATTRDASQEDTARTNANDDPEAGAAASGDDAKAAEPSANAEGHVDDKGEPTDLGRDALAKQFPWADKRISKQSADIRELRAKLITETVKVVPTPEHPLAAVDDLQALDTELTAAKQIRQWCRDNPDGGEIRQADGSVLTLSEEQTQARLAHAERVIESAPDVKARLNYRAQAKPWEIAEQVAPKMFEPGSQEASLAKNILMQCPQIKTQFPDWEHLLACAVRGYQQSVDERAGKARYVRVELDANGKPVIQKKTVDAQAPNKGAPTTKPPAAPNAQRPVQKSGKARTSESDAVAALPAGAPAADRLSALLDQAASAALAA